VRAWDRRGKDLAFEVKGLTAGTFQHEVDHIDGKLFVDGVVDTRTLSTFGDFERFHKEAFVARAKALVARFGS
jgi:peptide deformylase